MDFSALSLIDLGIKMGANNILPIYSMAN